MSKRKTISKEIIIEGKGLHKGGHNTIILKPSYDNSGIKFVNTDNGSSISLSVDFVSSLERGTSISDGRFTVHTIEHLLSVLMAFEISDLYIEISGDEIPVLDGCAKKFVDIIKKAEVVEKKSEMEEYIANESFIYVSGESFYKIEPSDSFKIECLYENQHPLINKQNLEIEININNYINQISGAKTFGFDYEVEQLRKNGLALGGDLNNAIILSKDSVINPDIMSFKDEFVRHKILDLLGDLKILNINFSKTKITAKRPSHKSNYELIKLINTRRLYGKSTQNS